MNKQKPYKPLLICLGLVLLDQWTKVLAEGRLAPLGSIDLLPFFSLTYVQNQGVSFGMMQGVGNRPLAIVNLIFTAAIYIFWRKRHTAGLLLKNESWGLLLIFAGALGNVLDRLLRGYVVDFFDFKVWPVFNVADSMITIGVGLYLLGALFRRTPLTPTPLPQGEREQGKHVS